MEIIPEHPAVRRASCREEGRSPAIPTLVASVLVAALGASVLGLAGLRVPPGAAVIQSPGEAFHLGTSWVIEPSYPHDAICFLNYLTDNPYYGDLFEGAEAEPIAGFRSAMGPAERAAARRLDRTLRRGFGIIISTAFLALYDITGERGLASFAAALENPAGLRKGYRAELETFYRFRTRGWRLPAPLFDRLCLDGALLLRFLERAGFEGYWTESVAPELEGLARSWRSAAAGYDVVRAVERVLGFPLPSGTVRVRLARYARPNGISLGGSDFVAEERIDAAGLARTALHESLHGWVDWTGDLRLSGVPESIVADAVAGEAYKERERGAGYNTPVALAEEALVKALDQIASRSLGVAQDERERWFFHDGGLHASAPLFSALLSPLLGAEPGPDAPTPIGERLAAAAAAGELEAGDFAASWKAEYGLDRPGRLPTAPSLVRCLAAGDPSLETLHESYASALGPGMLVVFSDDWLAIPRRAAGTAAGAVRADSAERDGAAASLLVLDEAARRPGAGLTLVAQDGERLALEYRFGGNWEAERRGVSYYYRLALYYAVADGRVARPGVDYALYPESGSAWNLKPNLVLRF